MGSSCGGWKAILPFATDSFAKRELHAQGVFPPALNVAATRCRGSVSATAHAHRIRQFRAAREAAGAANLFHQRDTPGGASRTPTPYHLDETKGNARRAGCTPHEWAAAQAAWDHGRRSA
ncbi:hypothetical protein [Burkholderia plantarii]|uniref:hypothetical protein n=1 Tax=Burkholderia plantarii TaxID=41899 RepID=UPI003F49CE86